MLTYNTQSLDEIDYFKGKHRFLNLSQRVAKEVTENMVKEGSESHPCKSYETVTVSQVK